MLWNQIFKVGTEEKEPLVWLRMNLEDNDMDTKGVLF